MTTEDLLLTVPEVARRCSVSESLVRESIRRGELRCTRWGRRVLVSLRDLSEFVEARTSVVQLPRPVVGV